MTLKQCKRCNELKELKEFTSIRPECNECRNVVRRKKYNTDPVHREAHRAKVRANYGNVRVEFLMRKYNLTPAQFQAMVDSQDGVCDICREPNRDGRELCVDHDHKTGKVRALLCHKCNLGIEAFKENTKVLAKAMEYLAKHSQINTL